MVIDDPQNLWLLLLLVPISIIAILNFYRGKRALKWIGGEWRFPILFTVFFSKSFFIFLFFCLFYISTVLTLSHLRWGDEIVRKEAEGQHIIFLLDISQSMLARDVSPSRLERSKLIITNLVHNLQNIKFSLVVFKGDAFQILPISEDPYALESFLKIVHPTLIASPGSNIGSAVTVALESLTDKTLSTHAMLLFSDGENLTGNPLLAARDAREKGIPITCVAVGTEDGSQIPVGDTSYIRDSIGNIVVSRLNTPLLRAIANVSGGGIVGLTATNDIYQEIIENIETGEIGASGAVVHIEKRQRYQLFIYLSLLFLSLSLVVRAIKWQDVL